MSAHSWKKFVPMEATPIIAAMVAVGCLASFRLFRASKEHDVRFTRFGGLNDWEEKLAKDQNNVVPKKKEESSEPAKN